MNARLSTGKANRLAFTVAAKAVPYVLVLTAFALRLYRIAYQSIWWDEAYSVHLARQSVMEAVRLTANDIHPPLYYVLLHFWGWLAGFSELSVRFLSLVFAMLLVPLIYRLTSKLFDQRVALAAMAITTVAPLYVVYSQEARMYTLLPFEYLLIIFMLHLLTQRGRNSSWGMWIPLAIVEVLSLYTHYFAFFIVIYLNLFLGVLLLKRRQAFNPRLWLASQLVVVLLYLPWAWIALRQTMGYTTELFQPPGIASFARLVWRFYIWGIHEAGAAKPLHTVLSYLLAVAFTIACLLLLRDGRWRGQILALLGHTLIPLSLLFLFLRLRPSLHPRYAIACSVPFYMLIGHGLSLVTTARISSKAGGVLLALPLISAFVAGLETVYFDPTYFKPNVRGMVEYLEPLANADDVIIVHPMDYSVEYYYSGDAAIVMLNPTDEQFMVSFEKALRNRQKAFLAWPFSATLDMPGLLPFLLEISGRYAGGELFKGYSLRAYELEQLTYPPEVKPLSADFGDVRLTGAFWQGTVEANDAICLALRWQLVRETEKTYKAVVTLWDEVGRRLSSADMLLTSPTWGLSTERWDPGQEEVNYFIVPVPLGTPPLPYRLTVGVYDAATMRRVSFLDAAGNPAGEDFPLGEVVLTKAHDFERDPYGTRRHLSLITLDEPEIADGLTLEGFAISKQKAQPQEVVSVILRWRALRDGLPRYAPHLRLRRGDEIWAEVGSTLFEERYPTTEWARGEVVFEQRDFAYPPRVGPAVLEVEVADKAVALGEIELDTSGLAFESPPMQHQVGVRFGSFAKLLGYDLEKTEATTREKVMLTLYWQAINGEPLTTSFTVFTHLLSEDGRLIGQHDGIPAEGKRPTVGWVPGEVIADRHEMEFSDLGYQGKALIEVGLYESLSVERVPTEQGNDHLILPSEVMIK